MNKVLAFFKGALLALGSMALLFLILTAITLWFFASTFKNYSNKTVNIRKTTYYALIKIENPILSSDTWLTYLQEAYTDKNCLGVLLRINSPGGAVASSQEIYEMVKKINKTKPVITSFGDLAASGGYYAALGSKKIFANPGTLTGSIGVIMQFPRIHEIMNKWGLAMETVRSGNLKDAGTPFRAMTEEEKLYFQNLIDDAYAQFKEAVQTHRKLNAEEIMRVAQGQVFSGKQARAAGLVDTLGTLTDAKDYLIKTLKAESDLDVIEFPPKKNWFEQAMEARGQAWWKTKIFENYTRAGAYYLLPGID